MMKPSDMIGLVCRHMSDKAIVKTITKNFNHLKQNFFEINLATWTKKAMELSSKVCNIIYRR